MHELAARAHCCHAFHMCCVGAAAVGVDRW
jgi:hypothetical protein